MKKVLRYSFFAVGIGLLVSTVSVSAARGQVLGEILKRMDDHNKALKSVQAEVTMIKFNSQLNIPDKYTGTTSYLSKTAFGKNYMRLDWSKPAVEQISIIGDEYELYKPSINQVYKGRVDKAKTSAGAGNALAFMNMSREQLKANYTIALLGDESIADRGNTRTVHLLLTPKAAASYKNAELWVDGDGMPRQVKILEMNNDYTSVLLDGIKKNVRIDTNLFRLAYNPKSVKVIRP